MTLGEYLRSNGITHARFAERVGVSRSAVTQWVNRITLPSGERMVRIHRVTEGAVGLDDWHPPGLGEGPGEGSGGGEAYPPARGPASGPHRHR